MSLISSQQRCSGSTAGAGGGWRWGLGAGGWGAEFQGPEWGRGKLSCRGEEGRADFTGVGGQPWSGFAHQARA